MNTLVIDIGGTKFTVALFQETRIIQREQRTTDRQGGKDWMLRQIFAIVDQWRQIIRIDRCGVSFGGPVDFNIQQTVRSNHVAGWEHFPLAQALAEAWQVPVVIDNDANVAALGEAVYGNHPDADPLFYMTLSTGIGGGLIINRQIYRGADSAAGEIGHTTIHSETDANLYEFQGIYERACSGLWLTEKYGKSPRELFQDDGFLGRYVIDLALGLKNVIMLFNPACIVIGGGMIKAGDRLFTSLRHELRRQIPRWCQARINVVPATLGDDSPLYGALALADFHFCEEVFLNVI